MFRRTLTVTRTEPGQYVDGIWQEGAASTFEGKYSVQPTSPDDMQRVPEGRRDRVAYTLYGDPALRQADDDAGTNADRVEIDGASFEVSATQEWRNGIVPHHQAVVTKEPDQ